MRLRPLALYRYASFGITSSVDDEKPGANTLKSCSFTLNVNHMGYTSWAHTTESHRVER